jgi:hypothetical protein
MDLVWYRGAWSLQKLFNVRRLAREAFAPPSFFYGQQFRSYTNDLARSVNKGMTGASHGD